MKLRKLVAKTWVRVSPKIVFGVGGSMLDSGKCMHAFGKIFFGTFKCEKMG